MPQVHATAIVSGEVELHESVEVGPYCVLTGPIRLANGVRLIGRVHLNGPLTIGDGTVVYPGACLGFEPQDYKFTPGSATAGVVIGSGCIIREHVTVHSATREMPTRIGHRVFLMVGAHAGHDAVVEDGAILTNGAGLAGHTFVGRGAILSGYASVHQFARIGRLAMVSALTGCSSDVPPFCIADGRNRIVGINAVGMRRAGMDRAEITAARRAFREAFRTTIPRSEMVAILDEIAREAPCVAEMAEFVRTTRRGIAPGTIRRARGGSATVIEE